MAENKKEALLIATRNKGKIREFRDVLEKAGFSVFSVFDKAPDLPEPIEDGQTFADNAAIKATYYAARTGMLCLADDSGLVVDALDGAPGVHSARYAGEGHDDKANNAKLIKSLQGVEREKRTARYVCVLALAAPGKEPLLAEGTCEGLIDLKPKGSKGFGYDSYFYVPSFGKTMAELDLDEKNSISHRGAALRRLQELLL